MGGNTGNGFSRLAFGMSAGAVMIIGICVGTAWAMVQGHAADVNEDFSRIQGDIRGIRQKVDAVWREAGSPAIMVEGEDELHAIVSKEE
jgi:hypothetical protein